MVVIPITNPPPPPPRTTTVVPSPTTIHNVEPSSPDATKKLKSLVPIGSTLEETIRLRREQLADVCELLSELLCANGMLIESKESLERALSSLHNIAITVENKSTTTTSLLRSPLTTWSIVPPLRWATTLTNLGLVERALGTKENIVREKLLEALSHVETHVGGINVHAAEILEHIAVGYVAENMRERSAVLRERVLTIVSKYHPGSMSLALAHENLGEDYYALGTFQLSEEQFQIGLELREHLCTQKIQQEERERKGESESESEDGTPQDDGETETERRSNELRVDELRSTEIGHTVSSVIDRLQRRDVQRKSGKSDKSGSGTIVISKEKKETSLFPPLSLPSILPSPKVLMETDVQRSYRNVASASILLVKKNKKERKVKAKAEHKRKQRARKMRIADDRNYVKQRAERHAEGLVKLTGLRE